MDIAMAKMEHLHSQAQAMMSQGRVSPTLGRGSPETSNTPIVSRGPSMSALHGAMLSHGHDILSKLHKVSYSSPPPIACSPENNVCKLINYRGAKVAAFNVEGRELICLPQAFELFLKHLVGGLHTVYTKLKRLDIVPVVCNVEQVRVLRGLGAIQPGVNRCKLISCKEFDILYDDCTNSSARPGRPPKRSPSLHASPETIDRLKKSRLDGPDFYSASRFFDTTKGLLGGFPPHPYTMGHLPFMQLNHPLLAPPVSLAMAQQLGLRHEGLLSRDSHNADHDSHAHRDDTKDRPSPKTSDLPFHPAYHQRASKDQDDSNAPLNLHINGHAEDLRKSPSIKSDMSDINDDIDDDNPSDDDNKSLGDCSDLMENMSHSELGERISSHSPGESQPMSNGSLPAYSSIETLLVNIQGLLKVAGENARHQEAQIGELKTELLKERTAREEIEKQLTEVKKQKVILLKRLRRERRARATSEGQQGTSTVVPTDRLHSGQSYENSPSAPVSAENEKRASPVDDHKERFSGNSGSSESEVNGPTGFQPSV